jgi:transposase
MLTIDPSTRNLERVGDGLERHVRPPIKTTFFRSRDDCWNPSITADRWCRRYAPTHQTAAASRCFCRLKDFRRIATRYDKLARKFLAAVQLAAIVAYWIN